MYSLFQIPESRLVFESKPELDSGYISSRAGASQSLRAYVINNTKKEIYNMDIKDSDLEDKKCPYCKALFASVNGKNKHVQKNVCGKAVTEARSTRNSRPAAPPSVLLEEDHLGLLLGHSCPYAKYV